MLIEYCINYHETSSTPPVTNSQSAIRGQYSPVLREVEEGEAGEGGEGAGDLLQLAALQVQVLEGLLQPGEGSLRQSEIVVRELESFQSDSDEGIVGDILDPIVSQI